MTDKFTIYCTLLLIILFRQDALAIEPLSAQELAEHCAFYKDEPDSVDAVFCVRFIQGFIDGAIATDQRVVENVSAEYEREESFSERAMRTRVKNRIETHSPTFYADFCIGGPTPLIEVVEKVISRLSDLNILNRYSLGRNVVYQTLRDEYPCDEEAD
ncbi:MAG: hypothetical protein KTR16_02635 [Acidiferrobacterales bacterium]|nr:hypothetical protein [Acidiferrobacterales bacterium]